MTWTVYIEPVAGGFQASLVGDAAVRATGGKADEAVAGVKAVLDARLARGYFVTLDDTPPPPTTGGVSRQVREPYTPEEQEMMDEIVAEIYRKRDAQKAEWIAELEREEQAAVAASQDGPPTNSPSGTDP